MWYFITREELGFDQILYRWCVSQILLCSLITNKNISEEFATSSFKVEKFTEDT
jgi:hypothetical protein